MTLRHSFGKTAFLIVLATMPMSVTAAQVRLDTTHTRWQTAAPVNLAKGEQIVFARLRTLGEARWLGWNARAGESVTIELAVPLQSDTRFQPTLVTFFPDTQTIGPGLPFEQPPNTLARVYAPQPAVQQYEGLTQTSLGVRLRNTLTVESAGKAYLAVYSPSTIPGSYRLIVRSGAESFDQAALAWPTRWWYTQAWAGWSLDTLFFPALLLGLFGIGWWIHYRLEPAPKKKTKSRKKHVHN